MRLEGKRVYLRPLELQDANGNYPNWLNDKEVCKYNSHGDTLYTKQMALEYIKSVQNNPTAQVFAVCLNDTDTHIGNISLQQITQKDAEFAILMGEKTYWGQGYASEAGKLLIEYGLTTLNLQRIYCGTSEANTPMQRLATVLGMKLYNKEKKALQKNNQLFDIFKYELVTHI